MLGLSERTTVRQPIYKTVIYEKYKFDNKARIKFDSDISRIVITNEISTKSTNIQMGEEISQIYVVHIELKRQQFEISNIVRFNKLIKQNIIFVLEYKGEVKLAVYYKNFIQTGWKKKESAEIKLIGLNLDDVWKNIIIQISGIQIEGDNSLDEQLEVNKRRTDLEKKINSMERQAVNEKQPNKRFELRQQINRLIEELNAI